jgi:hypothetical protein
LAESARLDAVILSGEIFVPNYTTPAATKYLLLPNQFQDKYHYTRAWDRMFKAEVQSLLL